VVALAGDLRKHTSVRLRAETLILNPRSVLEMQVIATTLLENFAFSLPPQSEKTRIYRKPGGMMIPMVEGEEGSWMGLIIKALK
jgi:hypothetical protein